MLDQPVMTVMAIIFFILLIVLIILLAVAASNSNNCCCNNEGKEGLENKNQPQKEDFDDSDSDSEDEGNKLSEGEAESVVINGKEPITNKVPPEELRKIKDLPDATVEDPNIPLSSVLYHLVKAANGELDPPSKKSEKKDGEKGVDPTEDGTVQEVLKELQLKEALGALEAKTPVRRIVVKGGKGEIASDFTGSSK